MALVGSPPSGKIQGNTGVRGSWVLVGKLLGAGREVVLGSQVPAVKVLWAHMCRQR